MVLDAEYLVHHGLVGPLVEEGSNGVVSTVEDQQHRGYVRVEGEQISLPFYDCLQKEGFEIIFGL